MINLRNPNQIIRWFRDAPAIDRSLLPPKALVVLATTRSGSTLVCERLQRTAALGTPNEHFLHHVLRNESKPDAATWSEMATACDREGSGVFGIKLMYWHLPAFGYYTSSERVEEPTDDFIEVHARRAIDFFDEQFEQVDVVRVERGNVFDQALSRYRSRLTNEYHRYSDGSKHVVGESAGFDPTAIDFVELARTVHSTARELAMLRSFCDELGRPVTPITYGEATDDDADFPDLACQRLGVQALVNAVDRPRLQKIMKRDERDIALQGFLDYIGAR